MRNELVRFAVGLGLALALTFVGIQFYSYISGLSTSPDARAEEIAFGGDAQ